MVALATLPPGCTADEKPRGPAEAPLPPPVPRAHLRDLSGDVQIKRAVADEWSAARDELPLFPGVRRADVNDVLMNTLGAAAGYLVYRLAVRARSGRRAERAVA